MEYVPDPANQRVDALMGTARPLVEARVESLEDLQALRARWQTTEAMPVFVAERGEGEDHSWGGLDIRTLVSGEQSAGRFSVHSLLLTPGAELPVNYHLDAHAYLLVIDGEVEMQVGAAVDKVGKHSLGYVPPLTRVGLKNRSDASALLALVYSPAGAERAFAEAHDRQAAPGDTGYREVLARYGFRFDDAPLANDQQTNKVQPPVDFEFKGGPDDMETLRQAFFARPGVPRLVNTRVDEYTSDVVDHTLRKQLITGDDSAGTAMMNMVCLIPGYGAQPHHQPTEEEFFFVTDGPFEVTCGLETKIVQAGAVAFAPRNCTHGFGNPKESDYARFVTLNSPAGHERAMAATRKAMALGISPDVISEMSVAGGWRLHGEARRLSVKSLGEVGSLRTTGV